VIDSHTHLDRVEDPDAAVARAVAAGVTGMLSVGCGAERIRTTLEIARRNAEAVRVIAGVHPQEAQSFGLETWGEIEALCEDPMVVAIGETGFDQFHDYGPLELQEPVFALQAELARRRSLPLVIHTRAADRHTLDALARHADGVEVVLHCFSLADHVAEVTERGYWCSFAGNVTYPSAGNLRDAVAQLPPERILVETDAPFLTPVPHRGSRNEPAYVAHTLATVAEALGLSVAEADELTTANTVRLFGFEPARMATA
jgi:TatD DNase family protein